MKSRKQEAAEAKDRHAKQMSDLAKTVKMATLEKEMTEKKVRIHILGFVFLLVSWNVLQQQYTYIQQLNTTYRWTV
jgi:uncharacterized membrane protein